MSCEEERLKVLIDASDKIKKVLQEAKLRYFDVMGVLEQVKFDVYREMERVGEIENG